MGDIIEMDSLWVKFFILWIPFSAAILFFAPSLKWKIMFILSGGIGIYFALAGKSIKLQKKGI